MLNDDCEKAKNAIVLPVCVNAVDTGYGRSIKAKKMSAGNPARYFPTSDELLYGPILGRKISDLVAPFDSAV
jgi:hypothetical protein